MDNFENYLFNKISVCIQRIEENKGNSEVLWSLNNTLEEFVEILSEYNLNYKVW